MMMPVSSDSSPLVAAPLSGGAVAVAFGVRWVFLVTAAVLLVILLWVYYRVPEYVDRESLCPISSAPRRRRYEKAEGLSWSGGIIEAATGTDRHDANDRRHGVPQSRRTGRTVAARGCLAFLGIGD